MHYGGYLCRMEDIHAICREYGLALIEDACHAVGAHFIDRQGQYSDGEMAGTLGDIACFSFFSNKNVATGEGGMVVTQDDHLAERLRKLRSHGMTTLTWDRHKGHANSYDVVLNGYNYRLDELRAALGKVQLSKLEVNNHRRQKIVEIYKQYLAELTDWNIAFADYRGESACHLMVLIAPNHDWRDQVRETLQNEGIQTSLHYPCITDFKAFQSFSNASVPLSREFTQKAITLPLFPTMDENMVEQVCSNINDWAFAHKSKV